MIYCESLREFSLILFIELLLLLEEDALTGKEGVFIVNVLAIDVNVLVPFLSVLLFDNRGILKNGDDLVNQKANVLCVFLGCQEV